MLAEMSGPGVIERIWSANPKGTLKIALDGEEKPRLSCGFVDLFQGRIPPFAPPVTATASG